MSGSKTEYLEASEELTPNSPEWFAMKAIKAHALPQDYVVCQSFGAIFGALGAALEGCPEEEVERMIADAYAYFDSWAAIARHRARVSAGGNGSRLLSVQTSIPTPITQLDLESDCDDIIFDEEDL